MYVAELQPTFGQCQAGSLELPKKGGLESLQI